MAGKQQIANISEFLGLRDDTPAAKCPPNYSPDCSDLVFTSGGFATRPPFLAQLTLPAEIVWREEFTCKDGTVQVIALDVNGVIYAVSADGTTAILDTVTAGSSVSAVVAYGRIYMAFFNDAGGCDAPRQWDGKNLYRVSHGAPGAGPTFTPVPNDSDTYDIDTITQPASQSRGSSYFLQSSATGNNTTAGTTVTEYYSDLSVATPDADLVSAFATGNPVYVYTSFTGGPVTQGPITVLVTGVGTAMPPGQPRNFAYFTYEVVAPALIYYAGSGHPGYTANYQRTIATIASAVPIPGAAIGDSITIIGTSVANFNSTWPIAQTPNSGEMVITQTSITAGVGNYSYSITTGVPPVVGQTVSVIGTLNASGVLNVTNGIIATASGGSVGSFTINGFTGTFGAVAESGDAVTAGTLFMFDPGLLTIGTANDPIYGNSVGGQVIFDSSANISISSGKRSAVVFFIYPDEYTTGVTAVVNFTVPTNTKSIRVDNLPIGPGPVMGRGIAFTQANGSKFFYMELPQINAGVTAGTSTVVMDNISSSATFTFADLALAGGIGIDLPGNNLFQQVALNLPRGVAWYEDRLFWLGEKNTVIGFQNMAMDGGTLLGDTKPEGWIYLDTGAVQEAGISPVYVVSGPNTGELSQSAYQAASGAAIIQPKLRYSLRFWNDGGAASGLFQAYIRSATTGFASVASYDLSTIDGAGYYTMNFTLPMPDSIPADLTYGIKYLGLVGTVKIRDLQMIYADNPELNPLARGSYVRNPQAYDALTGSIGPNDDPTELRAIFRLQESLHFLTARALYDVQAIGNSEPSSWDPNQVSDKCGCFNANAVTTGKGWAAWAGSFGAFLYTGGIPQKTTATINKTWRAVVNVTTMFDDSDYERVYMGTVDAEGTRRLLVYDYHEVGLGGTWKWCPWERDVRWVGASSTRTTFVMGSKFYELGDDVAIADDDLGDIGGYHTFAPIGVTMFQKQYDYLGLRMTGVGSLSPALYHKALTVAPYKLNAFTLENEIDVVLEWPMLNLKGRLMFVKLGEPGVAFQFEDMTALFQSDPNAPVSGAR